MTHEQYVKNKEKVKFFLDAVTHNNTTDVSVENYELADEMLKELENVKFFEDDFEDNRPVKKPILEQPIDSNQMQNKASFVGGVSGKEYRTEFLNQVRNNFTAPQNYLQIADPAQGGYLLPSEMHNEIIVKLRENNILRQISSVIQTASQHKITIQATAPAAQWTPEGSPINLSTMTFSQKTLDAYKMTVGISISNEIKADSFYDLESHIITQFSASMAALEEQTFFEGDGSGKPLGLLNQLDSSTAVTTAGAAIAADDLISLVHKLPRPYRKNACFVMADETLAEIRKMKDSTLNYLWGGTSLMLEAPETLLGYKVYTSPNVPQAASGNLAILFGDFTKFIIGQRGNLTFRPLYEINAMSDVSTYLMTSRVDCILTDNTAITALKLR